MKILQLLCIFILVCSIVGDMNSKELTFREKQQKYHRVREAREKTRAIRHKIFEEAGLTYPPARIFLRMFKYETEVELWAAESDTASFVLVKTYKMTSFSGQLGPKREQGDRQIPEGFYHIDVFNPFSNFHLSMKINYPNKSDRIRKTKADAGNLIFIHGNKVTIGCIPVGDKSIEQLYVIAVDTKSGGQEYIPVHIFPFRMDSEAGIKLMKREEVRKPELYAFWQEIKPGYDYFERRHRLPNIRINKAGVYSFK